MHAPEDEEDEDRAGRDYPPAWLVLYRRDDGEARHKNVEYDSREDADDQRQRPGEERVDKR